MSLRVVSMTLQMLKSFLSTVESLSEPLELVSPSWICCETSAGSTKGEI